MKVKKFQMGGPAPDPAQDPAAQGAPQGGGMEEQIVAMAQEIISQLGPEGAAMLSEAIMQMLQSAPQEAPAYARKGGKLVPIKK